MKPPREVMSKEPVFTQIPKPRVIHDTKDLRQFLLTTMIAAAKGELNAAQTGAICNVAQQIYNTLNIELKMSIATRQLGEQIEPVKLQ